MEGLRVSKLEEGQQWGKNTSSMDKVHWGRRPPFIGGENPTVMCSARTRAVLPLHERYYRSGGRSREKEQPNMNLGAVVPLISGTTAHPSGTTAGGAEHGTKNAVAVLPPDRSGTTAYRRYYRPSGRYYRL